MKLRVLVLALLGLVSPAQADDSAPVTDPAAVQSHYREVIGRPEFHETPETVADVRWSERFAQWVRHLMSRFDDFKYAGQLSDTARVLVVILTALAVAGLIALFVRLSRRKRRDRTQDADEEFAPGQALLTPRQYERRMRRALEEQNWHGAWLAGWLQFLARLENRHLVEADRSRTNREYLAQLRAQPLPQDVLAKLVRMVDDYDRFIYGRRPIDEAGWSAFRDRIEELTLMLGLRERGTEEPA